MLRGAAQIAGRGTLATATVAAASVATSHNSQCLAPRKDVDSRKVVQEVDELELKLNDGWVLTEKLAAPVEPEEVDDALGNIISLGDNTRVVMQDLRASLSDSEDSVESIGNDADTLMHLVAAGRPAQGVVPCESQAAARAVNPFVRDAVYDVLRDPSVQRELYRSLMGSAAFTELLQLPNGQGVAALPAPVQSFYAESSLLESHELADAESVASHDGNQPNLFVEALHAIGAGLDKLGRAFQRVLGSLFADAATTMKRIAAEGPNHREQVAGGIMALAVACFAVIMMGRLRRA